MSDSQNRFWQIDTARGVAIVGMIIYHFLVDLEMIFHLPIGVYRFPLVLYARIVASMFILLVGISAAIRYEKIRILGIKKVSKIFVRRSLLILFWSGVISAVTFTMFRNETIVIGILHFIGISMILIVPFLLLKNRIIVILAMIFLGLGIIIPSFKTTNYWLLPFGAVPRTFESFDYFPIFPWFGIVLIGVVLGRTFISKRLTVTKILPNKNTFLAKIGQKSLLIYLLHQPILWSGLWMTDRLLSNR